MTFFADPALIGWVGIGGTLVAVVLAFIAIPRRRLNVLYSGRSLMAAPNDKLGLQVTFLGQSIAELVYVVRVDFQCRGNRDIAVTGSDECVAIEPVAGIDLITARFDAPGNTKVEVLESSARAHKFKFDLLKRRETISVDLYVKSKKFIPPNLPAQQFRTVVHLRDVAMGHPAPRSYRRMFAAYVFLVVILVAGFSALAWAAWQPVDRTGLLVDSTGQLVDPGVFRGREIQVCTVHTELWAERHCDWRDRQSVLSYSPAPTVGPAVYSNPISSGFIIGLIAICAGLLLLAGLAHPADQFFERIWQGLRGGGKRR